jgi:nitroreductase
MDVLEAIESRRSIFKFKPEPVEKAQLERILSYGIWAPNHHVTEPWRFVVLGDEARATLAERYAEIQMAKAPEGSPEDRLEIMREAGHRKFMSKPTIVVVSCVQEGDEQRKREDYAAACCAVHNIQLAAWSEGVGVQWSTGPITLEGETSELLGIDPAGEYVVGFLYMGYPEEVPTQRRKSPKEVIRWTA